MSKQTTHVTKGYFNIKELSAYSGISDRTLRNLMQRAVDPLPHIRLGHKLLRIRKDDFDAWMDRQGKANGAAAVEAIADSVIKDILQGNS